jgi:hypothetical protein
MWWQKGVVGLRLSVMVIALGSCATWVKCQALRLEQGVLLSFRPTDRAVFRLLGV